MNTRRTAHGSRKIQVASGTRWGLCSRPTAILSLFALILGGCAAPRAGAERLEQDQKVVPTDELAVLTVTLPKDFLTKGTESVRLPGLDGSGSWSFIYYVGEELADVTPGEALQVRPGDCLYVAYRYHNANGDETERGDNHCDLGLTAGKATTVDFGAARIHFGQEPLRVDVGRRPLPRLVSGSGRPVMSVTARGAGANDTLPWSFNMFESDIGSDFPSRNALAVPLRAGTYSFEYNAAGLSPKAVTVTAGDIADFDVTPADVRATVQFKPDDPQPFPGASRQLVALDVEGVDTNVGRGYLVAQAAGFSVKFFSTDGAPGDRVLFTIDQNATASVSVPSQGSADVVLPRIDVADVEVTLDGTSTTVPGRWKLERWNGTAFDQVLICLNMEPGGPCLGTGWWGAEGLSTQRGLFVSSGKYRVTVTHTTDADDHEQTKEYDVTVP